MIRPIVVQGGRVQTKFRSVSTPRMSNTVFVNPRRTGSKRPVDKLMLVVNKAGLGATQSTTTLVTVTFPCTIVGLRWDLGAATNAGTASCVFAWGIIIVRDGNAIKNIALSDAATFYAPEQNVMSYGSTVLTRFDQGQSVQWNGSTKTMRKMMGGDKLIFVAVGEDVNTSDCFGTIQFFCKT